MSEGFLNVGGGAFSRFGSVESVRAGHKGLGGLRRLGSAPTSSGGLGMLGFRRFGDVSGEKSGSGTLVAGSATIAGSGARVIVDLGTYDELIADAATMSGAGTVGGTGIVTAVLIAQAATMSGTGSVDREWSPQTPSSGTWTKQGPGSGGWVRQ
jgi:hypothetical protein